MDHNIRHRDRQEILRRRTPLGVRSRVAVFAVLVAVVVMEMMATAVMQTTAMTTTTMAAGAKESTLSATSASTIIATATATAGRRRSTTSTSTSAGRGRQQHQRSRRLAASKSGPKAPPPPPPTTAPSPPPTPKRPVMAAMWQQLKALVQQHRTSPPAGGSGGVTPAPAPTTRVEMPSAAPIIIEPNFTNPPSAVPSHDPVPRGRWRQQRQLQLERVLREELESGSSIPVRTTKREAPSILENFPVRRDRRELVEGRSESIVDVPPTAAPIMVDSWSTNDGWPSTAPSATTADMSESGPEKPSDPSNQTNTTLSANNTTTPPNSSSSSPSSSSGYGNINSNNQSSSNSTNLPASSSSSSSSPSSLIVASVVAALCCVTLLVLLISWRMWFGRAQRTLQHKQRAVQQATVAAIGGGSGAATPAAATIDGPAAAAVSGDGSQASETHRSSFRSILMPLTATAAPSPQHPPKNDDGAVLDATESTTESAEHEELVPSPRLELDGLHMSAGNDNDAPNPCSMKTVTPATITTIVKPPCSVVEVNLNETESVVSSIYSAAASRQLPNVRSTYWLSGLRFPPTKQQILLMQQQQKQQQQQAAAGTAAATGTAAAGDGNKNNNSNQKGHGNNEGESQLDSTYQGPFSV